MARKGLDAWVTNLFIVSVLNLPKVLPYKWRIPFIGGVTSRIIAPWSGHETRARENLALVCPELDPEEVTKICRAASNNAGRMFAEMNSRKGLFARIDSIILEGPGIEALENARLNHRPIVAVSGHFGNYDVIRARFSDAGHKVGGLYRPMSNVYFNKHYVRNLEAIASPIFKQSRGGLAQMIRHLRAGNMIALLTDQRDRSGKLLNFFGHQTFTPLSAADLALKYDAILIPAYSIRQENGLDFKIIVEKPIPHSDPETMMQAVNDSLEARVRANMGQWLWLHRRWLGA